MIVDSCNEIKGLQGPDGPLDVEQSIVLASCLAEFVKRFGVKTQPFDVLNALAELTIHRLSEGLPGYRFIADNVIQAAQIQLGATNAASTKLSKPWTELERIFREKEIGLQDFARAKKLKFYLCPSKEKNQGAGNFSYYYLSVKSLPSSEHITQSDLLFGEIDYIQDLLPSPSLLGKLFLSNGYRLEGWRNIVFIVAGMALILIPTFVFAVGPILVTQLPKLILSNVYTVVFFVFIGLWSIMAARVWFNLIDWRIIMAPNSLISLKERNVQLEMLRGNDDLRSGPITIRLIRYASSCPICGGRIDLHKGRKEFVNRLVGRCRENPAEHLYSFDRFSRRGKSLR